MAYVQIPRDLSKVKVKFLFGLTKRQFVCFGTAAIIGIPIYFATKDTIGNSSAVLLMMFLMLPAFFMAMYERDGVPAEKVLFNIIRCRWFFPSIRPYRTDNFYNQIEKEGRIFGSEQKSKTTHTTKRTTATHKQKRHSG
ncbi:MAG: PrgI family protein [Defluviitaleaceae bacterium]|nr:PrgI family protein [Defluviitaleaceae bacterium]